MTDPRDFEYICSRYNHHQNPWAHVVIGVRLDIDAAGQGAHTDRDVATLIVATQNGATDVPAIIGGVEQVDHLIQVLEVAKAKLEQLQADQNVRRMEAHLNETVKRY